MRLIRILVSSYIWIGLAASSSYLFTSILLTDFNFCKYEASFVLFSTTALYNILAWFKRPIPLINKLVFLSSSILSVLIFLFKLDFNMLFYLTPALIIGFFYGFKWQVFPSGLRGVSGLKIFLIAVIWVYVSSAVFPIYHGVGFGLAFWLLIASQLCFLVAITIPFDIRDIEHDDSKMKTIPQILGVERSKILSVILIVLSLLLTLVLCTVETKLSYLVPIGFTSMLAYLVIIKTRKENSDFYFTGMVDGILVFQGLVLYGFEFSLSLISRMFN